MADGRVAGKVFVVTGGTQGAGEGIAMQLAEEGAAGVVICGRNEANGERVAGALRAAGAEARFARAELASEPECRAVIAACDEAFGRLDGLVNAAGITDRGTLESTTVALWDRIFAVNVRAPFILTQDAVKIMKREGQGGAIANIISQSGYGGQPFLTPYSTSKGALAVFTKNVAHALRGDRIRVNGIMLGWTDTPAEHVVQRAGGAPPDWLVRAEAEQPFGRLIKVQDVAYLTTYLMSDESEMLTGALIDLDQNVVGGYD
jgi:NAD(P)-dependent dehydrogenase (short-subunit alcohol dehydrogenase family)